MSAVPVFLGAAIRAAVFLPKKVGAFTHNLVQALLRFGQRASIISIRSQSPAPADHSATETIVKKLAVSTSKTKTYSSVDNEYHSKQEIGDFSIGKGEVRLGEMLWALHNRAARRGGVLVDPDSVHIHEAIDYDFAHHFGHRAGSLFELRAAMTFARGARVRQQSTGPYGSGLSTGRPEVAMLPLQETVFANAERLDSITGSAKSTHCE